MEDEQDKDRQRQNIKGLSLSISKPAVTDIKKCIICQKKGTKLDSLYCGEKGRKRVCAVAEIKDDIVNKRLKILGPDSAFKYHNTYACYKQYTDMRKLTPKLEENIDEELENSQILTPPNTPPSTRSTNTPRAAASTSVNPLYIDCAICGSDRVRVKDKRVREKFRICTEESAQKFLEVIKAREDNIFVRCADLNTPEDVFAADIYCHNKCYKQYVLLSRQKANTGIENTNVKQDLFTKALFHLDPLFYEGYGFTVTEIKEFILSLAENENVEIYNRDVKNFLVDHYGDKIQFCPSHRVNEPEMCFSSVISVEDIAKKMRDINVVKSCGEILRDALRKVDFQLNDKFCDGHELKESWEKTQMPDQLLTFFASLFNIKRSRMLKIEMIESDMMSDGDNKDDDEEDDDGDDGESDSSPDLSQDIDWAVINQHNQLNCLFQIMYYQMYNGARKTPLHSSFGQYQYGRDRSRELLTVTNRIGVSTSYNEVRRSRRLLAAYAVEKSCNQEIPIPSTFSNNAFTIGAMDNGDFNDKSSISGMESDHVTMQVLFQESVSAPSSKPLVSDTDLRKSCVSLPDKLPCQKVPIHCKPALRPSLPTKFNFADDLQIDGYIDNVSVLKTAEKCEFLLSLVRHGLPNDNTQSDTLPTWSGTHALISTANVPLMRIGFLPMIPSPVTDYATVRKALVNFQSVRRQLNSSQSIFPVFCDEGVFHTLADIIMAEPGTFSDIHGMMGMFHWVKVLLKCAGRYLRGSGVEDGLIETEVFGKLTLTSVLEGSHYVRSFQGIMIVSDVIESLMWQGFWLWITQQEVEVNDDVLACSGKLKAALCGKNRSSATAFYGELVAQSDNIQQLFESFLKECSSKSELCQYWIVFQKIVLIIKHIISSDREGNFALHMASVAKSLPIFREIDCLNYLRYGSFYLESTRLLETTHPEIFQHFVRGLFVVKDRSGCFNAVAPDMKLEQSIQRASKSKGGIVGQTRNAAIVVEWQLIFHEILLISNNLREMTKDTSMGHSECAVHHDLNGKKAEHLNRNVSLLLDFVCSRGNPFIVEAPGIKLHNFVTKQVAAEEVSSRLRYALENGNYYYQEFRKDRLIEKNNKLSATISKRNLPQLDYKPATADSTISNSVLSAKMLVSAQRDIDIAKERGWSLEAIFTHDILPSSLLFDGNLPSKPGKSKLMVEIEKCLVKEDMVFQQGEASVVVDFMSKIRSITNLSAFGTFANVIKCVLAVGKSVCSRTSLHVVFDSYLDSSVKGGERTRCGIGVSTVDMAVIGPEVPIPQQMEKFWPSPSNKVKLQHLTRVIASEKPSSLPVILSGCVVDDEVLPAEYIIQESPPVTPNMDILMGSVEEADERLLLHCAWEVSQGSKRVLVVSNDTDTVVRLLRFFPG